MKIRDESLEPSLSGNVPGWQRAEDGRLVPPRLFVPDGLDEEFWRVGYVQLPLLAPHEVEAAREEFAKLRPADGFDPRTLETSVSSYHCTFLDPDRGYRRASDALVRQLFADKIAAIMPGYRILLSNIYVKQPGLGRFAIHQNWPTILDIDIPTFTVWIPIQDTGFHNGGLRLVPGCHRILPDIAAATSERFFDDFDEALIESYLRQIEMQAGEALVFDDSLLHWSADNLSDSPRVTFQVEIIPEGATAVLWIRNPDNEAEWEVWEADTDYWTDYDFQSVFGRPEGLRLAGRYPNENRKLTVEEFDQLLRRADEIRRSKFLLP